MKKKSDKIILAQISSKVSIDLKTTINTNLKSSIITPLYKTRSF